MIDDPQLPRRFWNKVVPEPMSGCWLWVGNVNYKGYGLTYVAGTSRRSHRVAFETLVGPIPGELVIDHLCRTRCCVNPAHLELVTSVENTRRGNAGKHLSAMTHCTRGHLYDDANTYMRTKRGRPYRTCRTCHYGQRSTRKRAA